MTAKIYLHPLLRKLKRKKVFKKVCLTKRQAEVYNLYKGGLTQREIAQKLNVSEPTISLTLKLVAKQLGRYAVKRYSKNSQCEYEEYSFETWEYP